MIGFGVDGRLILFGADFLGYVLFASRLMLDLRMDSWTKEIDGSALGSESLFSDTISRERIPLK
jgi:hypothetical protein